MLHTLLKKNVLLHLSELQILIRQKRLIISIMDEGSVMDKEDFDIFINIPYNL